MDPIIARIRSELEDHADPDIRESSKRFFKEEIRCYGMKTTTGKAIAKAFWAEVKGRPKEEVFALCEELFASGYMEESFIASYFTEHLATFEKTDLLLFRRWIDTYITNWAACDTFCNHTVGDFIDRFPECTRELKAWTQSENRWMRRAAAVSLIVPAKRGRFLNEALEIAALLLTDTDDMVQKGYGWLLKEASREHPEEVFEFIMQNKKAMPRTALRYAVEKLPKELRTEAMMKDW